MDRRGFLKQLLALVGAAAVPALIQTEFLEGKIDTVAAGNFEIDWVTKTIKYIGGPNESITVLQLHRWFQELCQQNNYESVLELGSK